MATLIGAAPPGLTFQDLVGGSRAGRQANSSPAQVQDATTPQAPARDHLMRIYLPEGVVRVMALTRRDEFLLSYSLQDNGHAGAVANTPVRGAAQDASRRCCVTVSGASHHGTFGAPWQD